MAFNTERCKIKTFYCGNGDVPDGNIYSRKGTSYECMRKGFGAGSWGEKKQHLPQKSLQRIKYIGPASEKKFKSKNINNTDSLITKMRTLTAAQKKTFLEPIFTRANNTFDYKGYNNVLLFLHVAGVDRLPTCREYVELE